MSAVSTQTAPDFATLSKDVPRLLASPGKALELMVLAADGGQCAGIDLDSGALVRAWCADQSERRPRPYDVVKVTLAADIDAVPDPSEPEALVLDDAPEVVGRVARRRAERLIKPLLHPTNQPLLGFHAPGVPFWQRKADHPSIALVEPEGPIVLHREGGYLACRFGWQGTSRELACLDRKIAAEMDAAGATTHTAPKGDRLVVALTPPIDGHCHKVVETVLERL